MSRFTRPLVTRLTEDQHAALAAYSERVGKPAAEVVRSLVDELLALPPGQDDAPVLLGPVDAPAVAPSPRRIGFEAPVSTRAMPQVDTQPISVCDIGMRYRPPLISGSGIGICSPSGGCSGSGSSSVGLSGSPALTSYPASGSGSDARSHGAGCTAAGRGALVQAARQGLPIGDLFESSRDSRQHRPSEPAPRLACLPQAALSTPATARDTIEPSKAAARAVSVRLSQAESAPKTEPEEAERRPPHRGVAYLRAVEAAAEGYVVLGADDRAWGGDRAGKARLWVAVEKRLREVGDLATWTDIGRFVALYMRPGEPLSAWEVVRGGAGIGWLKLLAGAQKVAGRLAGLGDDPMRLPRALADELERRNAPIRLEVGAWQSVSPKHVDGLLRLMATHKDEADWRTLGEWFAAGWGGWIAKDGFTLEDLAFRGGQLMEKAKSWAKAGKRVAKPSTRADGYGPASNAEMAKWGDLPKNNADLARQFREQRERERGGQ